jgi:hypothetical protein
LTRSAAAFESAERRLEGRRKFTKLLTLANGRSNSLVKLFCLADPTFLHLFSSSSSPHISYYKETQPKNQSSGVYWTLENKTLSKRPLFYEATTPHDQTKRCRRACPKGLHWVSASSARSMMQLKMFDLDPCAGEQQLHHPSSRKSTDFCLKGTASANTLPQKL